MKMLTFHQNLRKFVGKWRNHFEEKPILSSGIFCRHYDIIDIFVGPFIFSANKETFFRKKMPIFRQNLWKLVGKRRNHFEENADSFLRNDILSALWNCRYFCRTINFLGKQRNHIPWKMPIFHQNLTTFVDIWRSNFEENADSFFTNFILSASCRYFVGPFLNLLWKIPIFYRDLTMKK